MAFNSTELIEKKNSILNIFKSAIEELKDVKANIESSKKENSQQISNLNKENNALTILAAETESSIKTMNKLLGIK